MKKATVFLLLSILVLTTCTSCGKKHNLVIANDSSQNLKSIELRYNDSLETVYRGDLNVGKQFTVTFPESFTEGHVDIVYTDENGVTSETELVGYYSGGYPVIKISAREKEGNLIFAENN